MNIKVIPPDEDRKEIFDKRVKPLLVAVAENNAVDKWMFNLTENGDVDKNSIVFVSSKHMKIFIVKGIHETKQPPPLPPLELPDLSSFPSDVAKGQKQHLERRHRRSHSSIYGLPRTVSTQRRNGTWKDEIEKWGAGLEFWDISNGRYLASSVFINGASDVPSLEELGKLLDFELWVSESHNNSYLPYQQLSKNWRTHRKG